MPPMDQVSRQPALTRIFRNVQIDDDDDRLRLLGQLSTAFVVMTMLNGLLMFGLALVGKIRGDIVAPILVLMVIAAVLGGMIFGFVRFQKRAIATKIFLYGLVLYISIAIYLIGGVTSPVFIAYMLPVVAAGLLGESNDGVWLFVVALVSYIALMLLQVSGSFVPQIALGGIEQLILFAVLFGSVGGLLAYLSALWSNSTAHFTGQLREQSEALLNSNERLLEKNIQQVELGSDLSAAATQLLAASHQQASGATEQASAVSQVSTTIEELGSTARQIAIAAEQVADAAQQTLESLSEGQDAVDRSIQAMERIRNRVQDVSTRVLSLGERSQQIGEIIDLINDLSDETHLLALNAAIEAAGAGEHGRRFAVVAAEVKSLANRALAAAKEVKGVIAEIQQATNAAVLAAEEGGKEVERGVELAHTAGQVMDSIVMVAERTAQSGSEINLATAQQQSASEQVVETMREVADVARQTAAGARQMAESAQMLTAIAERLHGITSNGSLIKDTRFDEMIVERLHKINS